VVELEPEPAAVVKPEPVAEPEPEPELVVEPVTEELSAPSASEIAAVLPVETDAWASEDEPTLEEEQPSVVGAVEEDTRAEEDAVAEDRVAPPLDLKARIEETRRRIQEELERPFTAAVPVAAKPAAEESSEGAWAPADDSGAHAEPVAPVWVAPAWPSPPSADVVEVESPVDLAVGSPIVAAEERPLDRAEESAAETESDDEQGSAAADASDDEQGSAAADASDSEVAAQPSGAPEIEPVGQRYGDGQAEILDAWFENEHGEPTEVLPTGRRCAFVARVLFHDDVDDPLFGVVLHNSRRINVLGATNQWTAEHTGLHHAGDQLVVRFSFENLLAPERYHASPAIAHRGTGSAWIDRRERFVSVVVTGTIATDAAVLLPFEFAIDHETPTASASRA